MEIEMGKISEKKIRLKNVAIKTFYTNYLLILKII